MILCRSCGTKLQDRFDVPDFKKPPYLACPNVKCNMYCAEQAGIEEL
jgi:hypothetical protein